MSGIDAALRTRLVIAATLIVFAATLLIRLFALNAYAVDLPFWDQWDAEGWNLLRPFQLHEYGLRDLFSAHNEHRIVLSRLVSLGLFLANNRQWDNLVEASFNAAFLAAMYAAVVRTLLRHLAWRAYAPLFAFVALAAVLPYAAENLVSGFQNSFYFLDAMIVFGVFAAVARRPTMMQAVVLVMLAWLSIFCLASGVFAAPAIAIAWWLRWGEDRAKRRLLLLGTVALLSSSAVGVGLLPHVPAAQAAYNARDVFEFVRAAIVELGWPLQGGVVVLLVWAPWLLGGVRVLRANDRSAASIAAFALGGWVVVQCLAMAWSRGHVESESASRYADILVIGTLVNVYFLLTILRQSSSRGCWEICAATCLLAFYAGGLVLRAGDGVAYLRDRASLAAIQIDSVRAYLASGDLKTLQHEGLKIPYASSTRLAMMLDDAVIADMLPASVRRALPMPANMHFSIDGIYPGLVSAPHSRVWGSYDANTKNANQGLLRSDVMKTRWPYLRIDVAGFLDHDDLGLGLVAAQSRRVNPVAPTIDSHDRWSRAVVPAPRGKFFIEAVDHNPDYWFAFTEPVGMGRLSAWLCLAFDRLFDIAAGCLALMVLGAGALLSRSLPPQAATGTERAHD